MGDGLVIQPVEQSLPALVRELGVVAAVRGDLVGVGQRGAESIDQGKARLALAAHDAAAFQRLRGDPDDQRESGLLGERATTGLTR